MPSKPTDAQKPKQPKAKTPRPDEMTPDVLEFITAIDEYKRNYNRPFPSWSEILEIIKQLGYHRQPGE